MKKSIWILFLIMILGISGVGAQLGSTIYVPSDYQSIQGAIDAAHSEDIIIVSGGVYNESLNIQGKNNLTIRGSNNDGYPIINPSSVTDWNYFGYTNEKKTAIRIVESNNITIENIVLDCDLVKDNGYSGILYANSTGGVFSNNVFRNMSKSQYPNEDIMIYARADSPYTAVDRATLTLNYCDLYDTGKVALSTNNYIDTSVDHCNFYKTTEAYGLGMEIFSNSSASITNSEFHGFNLNENDNLPTAIYIDNLGTQNENGVDKTVTIQNCEIYNCQVGIVAGNLFYFNNPNNNVGNVDIILNIIDNNIHNNDLCGILMAEGYKSNGSSLHTTITGNSITVPVKNPDTIGVLAATNKNGDLSIYLQGNTISGYDIGLACINTEDNDDPDYSSFNISITNGNTFSNHSYGVGIVNINCPTPPIISGNYFNHNKPVHFLKDDSITLDLNTILASNTFDHAKLAKNVIYGDGTVIYADAPKSLIKGNETQIYTVKASYIEHLRSFTVRVQIPKADFATEPANFTLGSSFNSPVMITRGHTPDYWIFNVVELLWDPYLV